MLATTRLTISSIFSSDTGGGAPIVDAAIGRPRSADNKEAKASASDGTAVGGAELMTGDAVVVTGAGASILVGTTTGTGTLAGGVGGATAAGSRGAIGLNGITEVSGGVWALGMLVDAGSFPGVCRSAGAAIVGTTGGTG